MVMTVKGFKHIGVQRGVAKNRPTVLGHRLEPYQVVAHGTKERAIEDFKLTREQVDESHLFIEEQKKK